MSKFNGVSDKFLGSKDFYPKHFSMRIWERVQKSLRKLEIDNETASSLFWSCEFARKNDVASMEIWGRPNL